MRLIIDIPEEIKQKRDAGKVLSSEEIATVCMAIKNSTPLHNGHGRLIDANLFAKRMREISVQQKYNKLFSDNVLSVDDIFEAVISELTGESLDGYRNAPTVVDADGGAE